MNRLLKPFRLKLSLAPIDQRKAATQRKQAHRAILRRLGLIAVKLGSVALASKALDVLTAR